MKIGVTIRNMGPQSSTHILSECTQAAENLEFESLWGRRLQLIDCQNVFCEVSKYARVRHPEVSGRSGRTKIKQRFKATASPISYWYPPKWGLNDRVIATLEEVRS